MNILIVGLGSMGKRRLRLLREIFADKDVQIYGVDENPNRCISCQQEYGIKTYRDYSVAMQFVDFDVGFVCTAPLAHAKIISELLEHKINVFSEINLVSDGYEDNIRLAQERDVSLFLSSTPMYRKEIQFIKEQVKLQKGPVHYNYHVGQYLPDWHPWDVLQDFFVSKKKTNGCREIFAIELPWILDTFGDVKDVKVVKQRLSKLPIDYDDSYLVLLQHNSGCSGTLSVNVVDRKAERDLKIFGEELFIKWNGTPDSLYQQDLKNNKIIACSLYNDDIEHRVGYSDNIIENAYVAEVEEFLSVLEGRAKSRYSFQEDIKVLQLIDRIEE